VNRSSINRTSGRFTGENTSVREYIESAFGIPTGRDYLLSGPGWLDDDKFDINATLPAETTREQLRRMLQTLLAERFGLKTHYESKPFKVYALEVSKKPRKLSPGSPGDDGAFIFDEGRLTGRAVSMSGLADRLAGLAKLDRPVIDKTGIDGAYNFTLEWAREGTAVDSTQKASIFTALQEQLGLRLTPQTSTARILVVDHVQRDPVEN
jgi:uncharacterized protein (TIGR03435 family)